MFRIRSVAAGLVMACLLTGCGAAIYGAVIAAIVSQKTTTTTKTSAPLSQPTVPIVPGYAVLALSSSTATVTRNGAQVTDFKVVGVNFPSGFGTSISNRDTDRTLVAGDAITIRINQDATQLITFAAGDVTSVGTQVAATIQAKVQALKPQLSTVDPVAYSAFTASYDPTTASYRFVSGSPGDTSEVVFEPKPRSGIDTVKPTTASTATATRLGLGTAQGGIETAGAESVLLTILNSGTDSVSQGATVDLFISHSKTLDATAIRFDTISVPTAVAVGEARRISRTNADAPPATVILQDLFPGGVNATTGLPAQPVAPWYVIFNVNPSNGEKASSTNTLTAPHPIEIYLPTSDPELKTALPAPNVLDFVMTQTTSPISLIEGTAFSTQVVIDNVGSAVSAPVPIAIDLVLSSDFTFTPPAAFQDPNAVLSGVRINPTDPTRAITVQVVNGPGTIGASVNSSTITVSYDNTQTLPGSVATVQSLIDVLNASPGGLVDTFADGNGNPATDTLNALLAAAKTNQVVAVDIFLAHDVVTFPVTALQQQPQTFTVIGNLRPTAFQSSLLPVKLHPIFKITPAIPGTGAPENALDNLRNAANYVRCFNTTTCAFDTTTGATLPTSDAADFAALTAVLQRPVNTGSILSGHPRVLSFQIPDTGLAIDQSQLLVILRTKNMDPHVDLLTSTGAFLTGAEATTFPKTVVIYTPAQGTPDSLTFYAVVAPARFDESDISSGGETFDLTISVNTRAQSDLGLALGVNVDDMLSASKARYDTTLLPGTENDVLVPFQLVNGKAEIVFALPQESRVNFSSQPVFDVGTNTVITEFLSGQVPSPVNYQAVLSGTSQIIYRPTQGNVNTSFILSPGVYTIAFQTSSNLPSYLDYRLEIDTQFTAAGN